MISVISLVILMIASVALFIVYKQADAKYKQKVSDYEKERQQTGFASSRPPSAGHKFLLYGGYALSTITMLWFFAMSIVHIDQDKVGHLKRELLASNMEPGQIIARRGQKGPQAWLLPPGWHVIPFVRVLYTVEELDPIVIPEGHYGYVVAKDGKALENGQIFAKRWDNIDDMINAEKFLGFDENSSHPPGQRGPQLTVLTPAVYRINRYQFAVVVKKALNVKTGTVAVIRSNVQERDDCPQPSTSVQGGKNGVLSKPLVPKGCVGVWDEPLYPGMYYLLDKAYVHTIIPTRVKTWLYKGGYKKRFINLTVGQDGNITQKAFSKDIPVPKNAADSAIFVRAEGWTIPVELRALVQVNPKDAPLVVVSVGTLEDVENNIVTPAIRDVLRTIGGYKGVPVKCPDMKIAETSDKAQNVDSNDDKYKSTTPSFNTNAIVNLTNNIVREGDMCYKDGVKALDFIEDRESISKKVLAAIETEAAKAGVTVNDIRMGEPAIPPELLVARLRSQLANQMRRTFIDEEQAQAQRIEAERKKATADQQKTLVKAELAEQAADFYKRKRQKEGEGEKLYMQELAAGQKAQVDVLGEERTMQLQIAKMTIEAAVQNPNIVKVPNVLVGGTSNSLEGAAAILGQSNIVKSIVPLPQPK